MESTECLMGMSGDETEELIVVGQGLIEEQNKYIDKNVQLFEKLKNNYLEVNRMRKLMQDQVKNDIEALLNEHKQIVQNPTKNVEVEELTKQEQQLNQEYSSVKKNVEELSSQCKAIKQTKEKLVEEKQRLAEEKERLDNETTMMLPKKREVLSLYNNISNIRWDFEGSKDEIKGYISNKSDVKPFCFDKRKCSEFYITNSLWDSMKED